METNLPVAFIPHPLALDARQFLPSEWRPGRTLREHLLAAGIDPHREIVVFHNTRLVEVTEWDTLIPVPGDCIVVESVVSGGDGSNPIAAVLSIALMIFAPYLAPALIGIEGAAAMGSVMTGIVSTMITGTVVVAGSMLINKLFPAKQPGAKSITSDSPTYSLAGGSNRLRPYEPLPLLLGRHRIFPDYGAKPYTEFENDDQYLYQVFNFGLGDLILEDLRIGETPLSGYQDVTVTSASNGVLPGFWGNVDTVEGAALTLEAGWIMRTTGIDTVRIALDVVSTLLRVNSKGTMQMVEQDISIEYSPAGQNNWQPFVPGEIVEITHYWSSGRWVGDIIDSYWDENGNFHEDLTNLVWFQDGYDDNTDPAAHTDGAPAPGKNIWRWLPVSGLYPYPRPDAQYSGSVNTVRLTGQSTKPRRRTFSRAVSSGQYDVRVKRLDTPYLPDDKTTATIEWAAMRSYQEGTADYSDQTVIGLKIKATAQLNGMVERLSALGAVCTEVWNGSEWVWTTTTNPAWWYLRLARGRRNAAGQLLYGGGLSDERIDIEAIKAWAVFCDANDLSFSAVFDSPQTLADALTTIARCGFASTAWPAGKLGVVWDAVNQTPVMAFGMPNIIRGSFEVSYASGALADEIIVSYVNQHRNWEADQVRTVVPGTTGTPIRPSTVDLKGCTTNALAAKFANALAGQQRYRRRAISWEADFEGMACQRGDVIILSHDLTQWGYSGRIVAINEAGDGIKLDRVVPRNGGVEYVMIEYPDGTMITSSVAPGSNDSEQPDILMLDTPIRLQEGYGGQDHKWFFSPRPTPGKKVKIDSIKLLSTSRVRISATDEDAEYYESWNGVFTEPPRQTLLEPGGVSGVSVFNLQLTLNQIIVETYQLNRVTAAWQQRGPVESCTVTAWLDGELTGFWQGIRDASQVIDLSEQTGTLIVEVTPIGAAGPGASARASLQLSTLPAPAAPLLVVTGGFWSVNAAWSFGDEREDIQYTELWFSLTNNRDNASLLTAQPYPATSFTQVGLEPGAGGWYWARVVDTRGTPSAWYPDSATAGLEARAETDPSKLLDILHGALGEDQMMAELAARIALIDDPADVVGSVNWRFAQIQGQIDEIEQTPDYDPTHAYHADEVVKYNGGLYKAIADTTGNLPTNPAYWTKIGDYSSLADAIAAHTQAITTLTNANTALAQSITSLLSRTGAAEGAISQNTAAVQNEAQARTTADSALSSQISTLSSRTSGVEGGLTQNTAAISQEALARTSADSALSSQMTTMSSNLGGQIAAVQIFANTTANKLDGVQARWGVKVQATGDDGTAVSGIELLSGGNGKSVLAVLADKFLVYQPNGYGAPKQMFSMGTVSGENVLGFSGSAIFDGSIVARHLAADSITAENGAIKNLAVDTLKIKDGAITKQMTVTGADRQGNSSGTYQVVANLTIAMAYPGDLMIFSTGYISYGSGWTNVSTMIYLDGVEVDGGGGSTSWLNAVHSATRRVAAGQHNVALVFTANTKATIHNPTIHVTAIYK